MEVKKISCSRPVNTQLLVLLVEWVARLRRCCFELRGTQVRVTLIDMVLPTI